jgi:putative DNA primase/helicase
MTAASIAERLHGHKSGAGFMAKCPCHDDRVPSLSLNDAEDGKILVHDFGGCSQSAVIETLKARGWWPESARQGTLKVGLRARRTIVAEYNYLDAQGTLMYQVCRTSPKGFFQHCPDGSGGWLPHGPKDKDKVLYHLPEILEAPIVFCVEGERDVETLRGYGFTATTNCGGADAGWLPQYTESLRGREVIIVPDNDVPGCKRAQVISKALLGSAARIRGLVLPKEAKDMTNWFASGHSEVELISILEGFDAI